MSLRRLTLGLFAAVLTPAVTEASLIYGITSSNQLISFDHTTPGSITTIGPTGVSLVDIDFYPVNGLLYGIAASGEFYRVNLATGAATSVGIPGTAINDVTDMDFNPAADRMRIFSTNDRNFRMVPDVNNSNPGTPGAVTPDGTWSDLAVNLVGSAYTNNFDGVAGTSTTLYSIDTASDQLYIHSVGPAFATVAPVGSLGVAVGNNVGFDVQGLNTAYMTNDNLFYSVNLTSGAATLLGTVGGSGLISIAVVPEPGSLALLGLGALGLFRRRRTA